MQMGLAGVTGAAIEYALDGLSLRHTAIATNIANANTPGYRPQRVSFENQLASVMSQASAATSSADIGHLPTPRITSDPAFSSSNSRGLIDHEIVQLNRNVLQYQALIRGLEKYTSTISSAINEGKR